MAPKYPRRIPVTLTPDIEDALIKLQALLQSRLKKRMSVASIVRLALTELLATEAELSE